MKNARKSNLRMLAFMANKLGELKKEVVFLGGCTTALLITDPAVPDVRFTYDVDCIIDVISRINYREIEKTLRKQGFKQTAEDGVICRWRINDVILDIMPTEEKILGFSNRWYKAAIMHAMEKQLDDIERIRVVTAPYFLATKLEAFKDRGNKDFFASHDLEDIISVLDGRIELIKDIKESDSHVKKYLAEKFDGLLKERRFLEALPGHLNYSPLMQQQRVSVVRERLNKISKFK
jgi:hypothetical protein